VTGPYFDDDEPEQFRPVPHPDDRLWMHPSEMAAMHQARAHAETAQMPVIHIAEPRSKLQTGLRVAAGVIVVGAAALTLGVVSNRGSGTSTQIAGTTAGIQSIEYSTATEATNPGAADAAIEPIADVGSASAGRSAGDADEAQLVAEVHDEVANSLPRVQAATPSGMREGSGLFVTDEGHVATSAGLIDNADYVLVWTEDGQRWKANVIASDAVSDVAVIQIDSSDWPSVALGSGADLWSGQDALTLDHNSHQVQLGEVVSIEGAWVGIDSPTALPGSAVVDENGAVIAMVTNDGTNSHATPAWMLEQVAVDLISAGWTTHTWLGIVVDTPADADSEMIRVNEVVLNSPAHFAGLRANDLIDSLNGDPVDDSATLHRMVQELAPGEDAVLTVTRNGSRRIIVATLAAVPD